MVRQRHLWRRKTAHASKRVEAENTCEMMLPRPYMQPEILRGRGRRNRVPPRRAKPFHSVRVGRIERDPLQIVEHIVEAHDA